MTAAIDTATSSLPDALGPAAREFIAGPHRLLIGAERAEAADGRTFATLDPATGREIAQVPHAGAQDVDRAVGAARAAFADGPWASMPAAGRGRPMHALADAMDGPSDEERGGRPPGGGAEHPLLPPPRAGWRVRADHPLELPPADGRVEARSG